MPHVSLREAAIVLLANHPKAEAIAGTLEAIYRFVEENDWQGACHATSAIAFVLLTEQAVEAIPCLGEAMLGSIAFDHSWIEISGEVYDVAIARQEEYDLGLSPVIAGRHVDDGRVTAIEYGSVSGVQPMASAALVSKMSFAKFMDKFPNQTDGLWGLATKLGAECGLSLRASDLRRRHIDTTWRMRPEPTAQTDDERRRERNRRKRAKRER